MYKIASYSYTYKYIAYSKKKWVDSSSTFYHIQFIILVHFSIFT